MTLRTAATAKTWTIQREGWQWLAISPTGTVTNHRTKTAAQSYVDQHGATADEVSLGSDVKVDLEQI